MGRAKTSQPRPRWPMCLTILALLIAVCGAATGCGSPTRVVGTSDPPNVILVLTDDLDARLLEEHSASYPNISELAAEGTTFENSFVTDPLCCPSRATILRGQYAHNHRIVGNWWPQGGSRKFRELGHEGSTVATWLIDEGYRTVLVGKYMNEYEGARVPTGWDDWYGIAGNHRSTQLSENGRIVDYDPERHHLDDVLAEKAAGYASGAADGDSPFFLWLGTSAPHAPATPASRHEGAFPSARLPRTPAFDEADVSDKPDWVRNNARLDQKQIAHMEDLYGNRVRSMLAVDEMIVRGPGVPEGRSLEHLVLNNDLAPTFADLAGAEAPSFVDGRSLVPLLEGSPPPLQDWRSAFLVEAATELDGPRFPMLSGDQLTKGWRHASREDWGRPGLQAIRTEDQLYAEYGNGERELYNLKDDPHELHNRYDAADPELLRRLQGQLTALRRCAGADCRAAEDGR